MPLLNASSYIRVPLPLAPKRHLPGERPSSEVSCHGLSRTTATEPTYQRCSIPHDMPLVKRVL